ncbi:hypothetical protein PLICRDRAFT_537508 [Plicaturopsis crispa FD-325 SS-3]|nr:hypothetical protein PLICRDRAFT_537508 [Plicaturopsis crispa FD-325 SS-3]
MYKRIIGRCARDRCHAQYLACLFPPCTVISLVFQSAPAHASGAMQWRLIYSIRRRNCSESRNAYSGYRASAYRRAMTVYPWNIILLGLLALMLPIPRVLVLMGFFLVQGSRRHVWGMKHLAVDTGHWTRQSMASDRRHAPSTGEPPDPLCSGVLLRYALGNQWVWGIALRPVSGLGKPSAVLWGINCASDSTSCARH